MSRKKSKKAQSTLEYILICIAVIVGFAGTAFYTRIKWDSFAEHFEECRKKILEE